jgi:hypothetical protein
MTLNRPLAGFTNVMRLGFSDSLSQEHVLSSFVSTLLPVAYQWTLLYWKLICKLGQEAKFFKDFIVLEAFLAGLERLLAQMSSVSCSSFFSLRSINLDLSSSLPFRDFISIFGSLLFCATAFVGILAALRAVRLLDDIGISTVVTCGLMVGYQLY